MGEIPEADTYFILLESGGTIHPPFSFIENMQIITKTLREIHPYEHNPRKNDQAVDAVAESISAFGFKVPIIIDKNGTIVAGHTRYKAVFYADKSNSPAIMKLMSEREARGKKFIEDMKKDMAITASNQGGRTSTYDRWEKRNRSKFDAWFNGS